MAPSRGEERALGGESREEMAAASVSGEEVASSSYASSYDDDSSVPEVAWNWKQEALVVAKLWCVGFWDACCLNRAYLCCRRSKRVLKKTRQCFLLNGIFFLGSILILQKVVEPALRWLLNAQLHNSESSSLFSGLLASFIVGSCYVLWLFPLYIASFVLNCLWYNEIAAHGFDTLKRQASESNDEPGPSGKRKGPSVGRSKSNSAIESLVLGVGEQIYSVIMLTVFFAEVFLLSYLPVVGQLLKFILTSWLYAYYCFDYKWGLCRWSLEKRLLFFESNWAFFAGFGSPCVLATFFLEPLTSAGVMAVVFPIPSIYGWKEMKSRMRMLLVLSTEFSAIIVTLWIMADITVTEHFVLVATASDPEAAVNACLGGKESGLPRLHLFYFANKITVPLVRFFQTWWSTSAVRKKTQ